MTRYIVVKSPYIDKISRHNTRKKLVHWLHKLTASKRFFINEFLKIVFPEPGGRGEPILKFAEGN